MTRVVLGVGPVLVSTVVPFWVDIHKRSSNVTKSSSYAAWAKGSPAFPKCHVKTSANIQRPI